MRFERSQLRALGRKIRTMREARGWSLRRLAGNSGVSVAAVQKIEAGSANPSLLAVVSIVEALGASLDELIAGARKPPKTLNIVRGTLPSRAAGEMELSAALSQPRMVCRLIALPARERRDDMMSEDPLFGYVLDGGLRLSFEGEETTELSTGDSFHIAAETAAEWSNPLSRRSLVLCITETGAPRGKVRAGERA